MWKSIVKDGLPEGKNWVIVMTQDGTVYPATYNPSKKVWVPMFRGGQIESLMHGKVAFWQESPEGYPFVRCDKGHGYLQTPDNSACPTCVRFGFIKAGKAMEAIVAGEPEATPSETAVEEPVEAVAADDEQEPTQQEEPAQKPKRGRKKADKEAAE